MLDPVTAATVIDAGLGLGATFVDLFVEKNQQAYVSFLDRKVKTIGSGTDFGIGIRLVFGHHVLYGFSNSTDKDELVRIAQTLGTMRSASPFQKRVPFPSQSVSRSASVRLGLDQDVPLQNKIAYLERLDNAARKTSGIEQLDASVVQRQQEVRIFNSEGMDTSEVRHYTRISAMAIAVDGQNQERGYEAPGALSGWEFIDSVPPGQIAETVARRAINNLRAQPCPAGTMPVVIDNGFGGVIFHEACGHLLETTSVEKKASVFHDKMGEMIAHPAVSAVDDGTVANEWGSTLIDDEGMPTQKTQLIKDGKLVSFLVDRVGEIKTGFRRTGSGRRQSYKFAPASRMRNTFIEAGPYTLEQLIQSVPRGLYAKAMGGGSVVPGTGQFNFAIEEAYLIEDGRVGPAVKGATLIGTGPEVLKKISMVGDNFAMRAGMCGSVSGSIPVTTGQPAIKVDEILVGGKS